VYGQTATQQGNLGWAGSYATQQFGYLTGGGIISPGNSTSVSGQISANGSGFLAGTLDLDNPTDVFPELQATGSYSVGNGVPGRTNVKIITSNGTRNYIAYVITPGGRVQMLETDGSITAGGDATPQF
jgi:hypothetical protein